MKLSEFVDINPRTSLPKGTEAEFVPMEALSPQRRYVRTYPKKKYSGGAKFINGDTLFARITPCLENGKISQFVSDSNLPAFGSTEYWILRAKEGISDPSYVYYLAKSEVLRRPAEKSMVGASGRQRAQIESVQDIDIGDISLEEQKKIAGALSAYDDLIENNSKRIEKLEAMARMLYKEVYAKSTELSEIPLSDLADARRGISWDRDQESANNGQKVLTIPNVQKHISTKKATLLTGLSKSNTLNYSVIREDILMVGSNGNPERVGSIARYGGSENVLFASFLMRIRANREKISPRLLYLLLSDSMVVAPLRSGAIGAVTLRNIRITALRDLQLSIPQRGEIELLDKRLRPLFRLVDNLQQKNEILQDARDLLLPRLMSGEIKV